jgi:quercetin dioxygenase-like cupin family protein
MMAQLIARPIVIPAAGEPPKIIEEFIGRVNSATHAISIAKMTSPSGWREPGQTPEFDEYTIVLKGELQVETRDALHKVAAGQAIIVSAGEWVRYSTPGPDGAQYIAVCLPGFSPQTVHRDGN